MPTGFHRLWLQPRRDWPPNNSDLSVGWRLRAVLDQVATRYRDLLDQRHRAALVKMPGGVLLVEGVLRRHAVDRHDHLEAALSCALAGACNRALRGGASDDHCLDAFVLERLLEIGVVPFVGAAP